jgi:putative mRNA 3-end processing factor
LAARLGKNQNIQSLAYGESIDINGVRVSFHPAGHLLGSAQVRIEHQGHITVAAGDYKLGHDPTCEPFEPIACHTFYTESTYALPIYRWPDPQVVFEQIHDWWQDNRERRINSVIFAYSLGKAQRVLAGLDASCGPVLVHTAIANMLPAYRDMGIKLPPVQNANVENIKSTGGKAMVLAPPMVMGSPWTRKLQPASLATASGWMRVRGTRRRRNLDRGFVMSDHADWPGLLDAIESTRAEHVVVTHGRTEVLTKWLNEQGRSASACPTRYESEDDQEDETEP